MKLYRHILLKVLFPLIFAALAMAAISIAVISTNISTWTTSIGVALETAEVENIRNRIRSLQTLLNDQFNEINSDLLELEKYFEYIISNYKEDSYYPNWSLISSVNQSTPQFTDVSGYYIPVGKASSALQITSLLDDAFRFIYKSSSKYDSLLLGLHDGLLRKFPFLLADNYLTISYNCSSTGLPVVGYDPNCRGWYTLAQNSPGSTVCADPHLFASTGKFGLTCGKAVFNNSQFIGVFGANIYMNAINDIILEKVLERGYNYIIDQNNVLIFYPNLSSDKVYHLFDYEGITLTNFATEKTYTKNGESWLLISLPISNSNFVSCISVPWSDIQKSKIDLNDQSTRTVNIIIAVAASVISFIALASIFMSRNLSLRIIKPLNALTEFVEKLGKGDFQGKLVDFNNVPKEIAQVFENFQDLAEAMKFGNQAYYNGDWNRALENYQKIEQLMTRTNNQRGLGIVYSNKANTLRLIKGTEQAKITEEYEKAIALAKKLIESNKSTKEFDEKVITVDLADRLMNFGVYNMEFKANEKARMLFDEALNLYKSVDNSRGMAKTSGNKAQLLIQCNQFQEADEMLSNLISYAEGPNLDEETSQRLLQYAYMNYGRLHNARNQKDVAATCFIQSLNSARIWDKIVANVCAQQLMEYYKNNGDLNKASLLSEYFPEISQEKNIKFVLDTSGSMMPIIEICRQSIIKIVQRLTQEDRVSLFTFNSIVESLFIDLKVGENYDLIIDFVKNKTKKIDGRTAFYDALFESTKNSRQINDWVVALTDGEDNASKMSVRNLIETHKNDMNHIIIITVGDLKNEREILKICDLAKTNGKTGELIKVDNSNQDIAAAFTKAGDMMLRGDVVQQDL